MREADSLSADVIKVFIAPAGRPWFEGKMVMLGRRFEDLGSVHWRNYDALCLVADAGGVEESKESIDFDGSSVSFLVRSSEDACYAAAAPRHP
jgi:hypothetical protein